MTKTNISLQQTSESIFYQKSWWSFYLEYKFKLQIIFWWTSHHIWHLISHFLLSSMTFLAFLVHFLQFLNVAHPNTRSFLPWLPSQIPHRILDPLIIVESSPRPAQSNPRSAQSRQTKRAVKLGLEHDIKIGLSPPPTHPPPPPENFYWYLCHCLCMKEANNI